MNLPALATKVHALDLRAYLAARQWIEYPSRHDYVAIYRIERNEVLVPLDKTLADYTQAIVRAAKRIAEVEARSPDQVLRDLLHARTDVLRFALVGGAAAGGSVDMISGVALASGALHALRASASSVVKPQRYHPRMTLTDSDAFIKACRFGQTEIGSFVLTVEAPLEVDQVALSAGMTGDPFGRRTTSHLLQATNALASAIRRGTERRLVEADHPLVSANLCDAIIEMAPRDESLDIRLASSWSPAVPAPDAVPNVTIIERSMFERIASIGDHLRPRPAPTQSVFIGRVTDLHGEVGPSGLEGDVTMRAQVGAELLMIKFSLNHSEYQEAVKAHGEEEHVYVRGVLHRRARSNLLTDIADFKSLRDLIGVRAEVNSDA